MANQEQLDILKQGVEVWNKWREDNPELFKWGEDDHELAIDLSDADLRGADLKGADLKGVNLSFANLSGADLSDTDLEGAHLTGAHLSKASLNEANLQLARLSRADLTGADLVRANLTRSILTKAYLNSADLSRAHLGSARLTGADLSGANFSEANLSATNFSDANLSEANLTKARLIGADLRRANLIRSNFFEAEFGNTIFGYSDLSESTGLEDVVHRGPSNISTNVFAPSKGKISEAFLRGCGLSDWEIESVKLYDPDLSNNEFIDIQNRIYDLRHRQALQISSLFISYSHADGIFVDKLESHLNNKGVRFWRDVHDMTAGRMETQIDRAMRLNPTVLLILSEHSLKSDWVEHEVRTARALEKEMGRDALCPVALDDSWKNSSWPKRVMEQVKEYNILDFSAWKDDDKFGNIFDKLIGGLELFYK